MTLTQIQVCEDDLTIKKLIVEHGKQTHLIPRPGYPGPFRNHVSWTRDGIVYVVTHYHGFLLPADNGYVAMQMPMEGSTHEEIAMVVRMFIEHGMAAEGPYYADIVDDPVEVN